MTHRKTGPSAARDALILKIAQRRFFLETLETRNSDRLECHDVAVRAIPDAVAAVIEAALREDGIAAEISGVISHLTIELPTAQRVIVGASLARMGLIRARAA